MHRSHGTMRWLGMLACLPAVLLAACATTTGNGPAGQRTPTPKVSPTATGAPISGQHAYTPEQLRDAYGVTSLYKQGYTGKGQTVVVIDSFGSPALQQDMDAFDQKYGLPDITIQVIAPLGTKPFDNSDEMVGWAGETTEDVQIIHAIAPDAGIVVLTSPVAETEGTVGLPEFLQLEQYAVEHHLGTIVSQSWGASEYTLKDSASQQHLAKWNTFFQQATTQQGITFFAGSGDSGATDAANMATSRQDMVLVHAPTSSFPNDSPWVTSVGGTVLDPTTTGGYTDIAWGGSSDLGSGGGFSAFYSQPSYQQSLPSSIQSLAKGKRGLPDVASAAAVETGLGGIFGGGPFITNGTSAGGPLWSGLLAIANQMAGHSLGFINPALYQIGVSGKYAQDFRDVTQGNNSVYDDSGALIVQGYKAGPGWDAVTGWGVPVADHLLPDLIAATGGQTQ
ncbi:MAG TPA: S53 family peptidase [Ktedonobacterales bacterium]